MGKSGVRWIKPPKELGRAIERYGERAWVAIEAVGQYWGVDRQNAARRNAPWEDRTGNARTGLFADVERNARGVRIVLGHTVYYGVFLELARGGKYAIIMPTLEEGLPELERMLRELVR